jgi:DNA polymerase-3 subunit gamma/tau
MDQAIACCGTTLTAESIRGLVGNVGSEVLEQLMDTVERSASEEALRLLDRLMTEGQNPAHFSRQFVRFLRNVLVAKVAGEQSPVLQISADERARAGRVAQKFSEEDLARFLQIMLRTHDEIGYRQEQRFHLELGVMKLVHAQRILPLEQILSGATVSTAPKMTAPSAGPSGRSEQQPQRASTDQRTPAVSPFEADRQRKDRSFGPEMSQPSNASAEASPAAAGTAVALENPASTTSDAGAILGQIVAELENAEHRTVATMLESATASVEDGVLTLTVAQPATMVDLMMGPEVKRLANAAASKAAGRNLRLNVVSGAAPKSGASAQITRPASNGTGARSRAADDPVVRRMQEKFGAEIRTVIDHRNRN